MIIRGPRSLGLRSSRKAGRNIMRMSAGAPTTTSRIAEVRFGIIIVLSAYVLVRNITVSITEMLGFIPINLPFPLHFCDAEVK